MKGKKTIFNDEIEKLIRQTGKYAMEEARKNGTYIVYRDKESGEIVREYPDGRKLKESECDD
jgi:hypothetical protein